MILGIDIGGTNTRFAIVKNGKILRFKKVKTPKSIQELVSQAFDFVLQNKIKIKGIGIGVAGVVDEKKGAVAKAPNIPKFNNAPFVKLFKGKFGVPVKIDNDVRCFMRAEAVLGVAKGRKNAVGIAIGTGIGSGMLINGKIYTGAHFSAGEVGHTYFGGKADWETIAGKKFFSNFKGSPEEFAAKARKGSVKAKKIFELRGIALGVGIANLINILDPEIVVLGGGAISEADLFLPSARKTAKKLIFNPKAKNTPIVKAKLGSKAGVIGATLLFMK